MVEWRTTIESSWKVEDPVSRMLIGSVLVKLFSLFCEFDGPDDLIEVQEKLPSPQLEFNVKKF